MTFPPDPDDGSKTAPSSGVEWVDGAPVSPRFGDVYFSRVDGLTESRSVFLNGCGLPQAWRGRGRFTVAELGFGTGLNIAALLDLWGRTREAGARLSIFSVEAYPLTRDEAARALAAWPEIAAAAAALLGAWPDGRRGFHRLDLPAFAATLDLYIGEVHAGLAAWSGPADAWFLDGFAPARNPAMWSEAVLGAVGRLSAPGAGAATFTVAGAVRRGLAAAGFEVAKRPGHGAKRERLEARRPDPPPRPSPRPTRVIVIGGGIAGAALVRALTREGVACLLVEADRPGAGASGNPAALVTPRLDAGLGPAAVLHAQAFARAVDLYHREAPKAVVARGVLQLATGGRDPDRFVRLAAWDGFAPGALDNLATETWSARLDEPAAPPAQHALRFADGLVVTPAILLERWLDAADRVRGVVTELVQAPNGGWRCLAADGAVLAEGDAVCVAAGADSGSLTGLAPLRPIRGQLEYTTAAVFTGEAAAWGAYAIPLAGGGALFGASHIRGDTSTAFRPEEREHNLRALATYRPGLAARIAALPLRSLQARVAARAATADHLPLAGSVQAGSAWAGSARAGMAVLAGLGGRGFTLAPLLAEHVVSGLLGAPSPLPVAVAARCDPRRFEAVKPNPPPAVPA